MVGLVRRWPQGVQQHRVTFFVLAEVGVRRHAVRQNMNCFRWSDVRRMQSGQCRAFHLLSACSVGCIRDVFRCSSQSSFFFSKDSLWAVTAVFGSDCPQAARVLCVCQGVC